MYPYSNRSQSQAPAPPTGSPYHGRPISASQSPEQSRMIPLGRPVNSSEYGGRQSLGPPPGHDGFAPWHAQHSRHPSSGRPKSPPRGEMREYYGPPLPSRRDQQQHRSEDYGHHPPPWLEDRGYSSGRRTPLDERHPSHPHPQSLYQGSVSHGSASGYAAPTLPPFSSHPSSPTHRPRTPPSLSRQAGGPGLGRAGGMPWDPAATGPMSAPPSLVPRVKPGRDGLPHPGPPMPSQQHNSPPLPSLGGAAPSASTSITSRDGKRGHTRLPSWGPHSSSLQDGPPASPRQGLASGNSANRDTLGGAGAAHHRGSSTATGDPYYRSNEHGLSGLSDLSRKRPASESPPYVGPSSHSTQQASPSQRADVMSMSSILGPSSSGRGNSATSEATPSLGGALAEKRRRLEGPSASTEQGYANAPSASAPLKQEHSGSSTKPIQVSVSTAESAAANLARRKWSGPIAEEAAQQAAAWRAQEQGRWGTGNTRSPKIGSMASLPSGGDRATPPFRPRGTSPAVHEANQADRRQRSDEQSAQPPTAGLPTSSADLRGQQSRIANTRPPSSPTVTSSVPQQKGVSVNKPTKSPKQTLHKPPSPSLPPSGSQARQPQQMQPVYGAPVEHAQGPTQPPPQLYSQPSYHAYDSQGRPVEIDVDEVRGGAFAGHGNPPPLHIMDPAYGHGVPPNYEDARARGPPAPVSVPSSVAALSMPPKEPPHASKTAADVKPQQAKANALSQGQKKPTAIQNGGNTPSMAHRNAVQAMAGRDRDARPSLPPRRSPSPILPGPAKGLLPPQSEMQSQERTAQRPVVPSKDFNQGPRVDNEAVLAALQEIVESEKHTTNDATKEKVDTSAFQHAEAGILAKAQKSIDSRPHGKYVGSFVYDSRKSPLLPGALLNRNVGGLVEVRVSGQALGIGPRQADSSADAALLKNGQWSLGLRAVPEGAEIQQMSREDAELAKASALSGEDAAEEASAFWSAKNLLKRKIWGTDVYTDDSDVVAMLLHSGWINGPMLNDVPSWVPPGKPILAWRRITREFEQELAGEQGGEVTVNGNSNEKAAKESQVSLNSRVTRREQTCDLSVMLRIAPKLIAYKGSQRAGVRSRSWGNTHDGVSVIIESVALKPPGYASGQRGLKSTKRRVECLAELRMLASIAAQPMMPLDASPNSIGGGQDDEAQDARASSHNAQKQQLNTGGLLDILAAARLAGVGNSISDSSGTRYFWQIDPQVEAKVA